jgi:predicted RNA binding protein with dsRBD fold (UPF0201 family)
MPREWYINEALYSIRRLRSVLHELSEDEVHAALKLEQSSRRRESITRLLTKRAAEINAVSFNANLKEIIHGT